MMHRHLLRAGSFLAPITCVFCAFGGCSAEADTAKPAGAWQPPEVSSEFFEDGKLISPVKWANLSPPQQEQDASPLLASLHIQEVMTKQHRSGNFEDGVRAYPEWDPTMHFIDDLESLRTLAKASRLSLNWKETDREGSFVLREFELPDGGRIHGHHLALYFLAMAALAREGGLQDQEADSRLSDSLLMIGDLLYNSDSTIESGIPRIMILQSAWNAAFTLREQRALAVGDEAEAELWSKRRSELERVSLELQKHYLQQLGGG